MLSICPHCKHRIRERLAIHLKQCRIYRQGLKREFNKRVTQTLEYRTDILSKFPDAEIPDNIDEMPDIAFNDLVVRLEAAKNAKEQSLDKKKERVQAKLKAIEAEQEKQKQLEIEQEEKAKAEEENRLAQIESETIRNQQLAEKKSNLEKSIEERRVKEVKPVDEDDLEIEAAPPVWLPEENQKLKKHEPPVKKSVKPKSKKGKKK